MNLKPVMKLRKTNSAMIGCMLLTPLPIFKFSLVISDRDGTESEENRAVPILPPPILLRWPGSKTFA